MSSLNKQFTVFLIAILFWIAIFLQCEDIVLALILCVSMFLFSTLFWGYLPHTFFLPLYIAVCMWLFVGIYITYDDMLEKQYNTRIVDAYMWLWITQVWEVQEIYRKSDFYNEYLVEITQIGEESIETDIYSLIKIPNNFSLSPGQNISYSGKIYPLQDFNGFAYKKFMLSKGIYYSTSITSFTPLWENKTSMKYIFFHEREKLLARIDAIFPQKEAIFLWGILLWARESIPKDIKEDFNNSWLTHFIAVSGFNITICVIFATFLFAFFPVWGRVCMVILSIVWFSLFVWLWAPVVRAAIMGILAYIFIESGTSVKSITLLAFTAVCMCVFSPLILLYDVSFHLSFLAVIGIIFTQQIFKKAFSWVPDIFSIREALVLTLASLSFTLPIMMFQFGQVSLFAPFANIAVTWTIPLAMLTGAIALILDMVSPYLWEIFGFIPWVFLKYDMMMVYFFWNLEFALIRFDFWKYRTFLEVLYFMILIYVLYMYHSKHKLRS